MSWFAFSREEGFPTHYSDQHIPAHTDILFAGIITAILIVAISILFVLPAYTSQNRHFFIFTYSLISFLIGSLTILTNYGYNWEVGKAHIRTPYSLGSPDEINAEIKLNIGLRGINITLQGDFVNKTASKSIYGAVVDFNEGFSWEWEQGRFGFGPYAGRISREFRAGVIRGLPVPILQLSEYFTFDGEGIRFGRHYRQSGWYTHFFMWCAFVTWILSNILFFLVIHQGTVWLILTGIFQIISILIWSLNRNSIELNVPFESADGVGEVILATEYGSDFYLVIFNAVICIVIGISIYIADAYYPETLCKIFGIDPLSAFDEVIITREERDKVERTLSATKNNENDIELDVTMRRSQSQNDRELVSIKSRKSKRFSFIPSGWINGELIL